MTTTTPNTPSSRLAGHALVEALIAQGVDSAFGVPSDSLDIQPLAATGRQS